MDDPDCSRRAHVCLATPSFARAFARARACGDRCPPGTRRVDAWRPHSAAHRAWMNLSCTGCGCVNRRTAARAGSSTRDADTLPAGGLRARPVPGEAQRPLSGRSPEPSTLAGVDRSAALLAGLRADDIVGHRAERSGPMPTRASFVASLECSRTRQMDLGRLDRPEIFVGRSRDSVGAARSRVRGWLRTLATHCRAVGARS